VSNQFEPFHVLENGALIGPYTPQSPSRVRNPLSSARRPPSYGVDREWRDKGSDIRKIIEDLQVLPRLLLRQRTLSDLPSHLANIGGSYQ
jgi:hypothetical protein